MPDFDDLYASDPDPWQVSSSWYEQRKIEIVMSALRRRTYSYAWDAGCGTGVLAAALAERTARVLATDASAEAAALSAARLTGVEGVAVEQSVLPGLPESLTGRPDLIVLSEVLYYLSAEDRLDTYAAIDAAAAPEADLVVVHWGPLADDAECSGLEAFNEASEQFNARGWGRLVTHSDAEFLLGLFSRDIPDHVGGRDGVATSDGEDA